MQRTIRKMLLKRQHLVETRNDKLDIERYIRLTNAARDFYRLMVQGETSITSLEFSGLPDEQRVLEQICRYFCHEIYKVGGEYIRNPISCEMFEYPCYHIRPIK